MTPTATTPAGSEARSSRNGSGRPSATHPRKLRQTPAPRAPRRVSGPAGGAARVAPRVGAPERARTRGAQAGRQAPFKVRARAFAKSLPDHAVIDRLVRGRAWILALGVMLAGIVAMQVEVLKLGASIGRSVQRASVLSIRNEQLRASVASLADDQRIERLASGMGMVMSPPAGVGFLPATPGANAQAALGNIQSPNATTFLNSTSSNGLIVTPSALAAANAPAGSASSTPSGTPTASGGAASAVTATPSAPTYSPAAPAPSSTATGSLAGATSAPAATAPAPAPAYTPASQAASSVSGGAAAGAAPNTTTPAGG